MDRRYWNAALLTALVASLGVAGCAPESPIADNEEDLEESEEQRDSIVGGQTTNAFPAVGALTRSGGTHCTGTVVAPRLVVTAAHCLVGVSASSLRFVLGARVSQPTASIKVASIEAHPNYDDNALTNDIGVVRLASDAPVTPVKMLRSMDSSWIGRELVFVGYGVSNGYQQSGAGTKRFVRMPVEGVSAKQFEYGVPGKNTCNGDSGGPAFAEINGEPFLAGVTSYGDAYCTQYGVDTRVDAFKSFIGAGSGSTDPCNGESFTGRCNGSTVIWCENQQVQQQACSGGEICGFSSEQEYFTCIEPAQQDPCNGETYEGRCDGNKLVWCENEQIKNATCSSGCGFDTGQGYYNCN